MFELIEKLRAKPPKTKKRIAFLVAFSLAIIIFIVWLTVIYPDFKMRQDKIDNITSSSTSPLTHFKEIFLDTFDQARGKIKDTKDSIDSATYDPYSTTTTAGTSSEDMATSTIYIEENP